MFIRLLLEFSVFVLLLMSLYMFSGIYSVLNIRVVPGSITVSTIPSFMGQQYTFPVGVSSLGSVVGHYGQPSVIDTEECRILKSDRSIQIKHVTSAFQVHKVIGLFTTVLLYNNCVSCHGGRGIPSGVCSQLAQDEALYAESALAGLLTTEPLFEVCSHCNYVSLCA